MGRALIPTNGKLGQSMQLSRLCTDTLVHLGALGRSPHTILNYGIAYRQFESYITTALGLTDDARHFTDERVVGFMNWMHEHRANSNTVRARLSALTALAKYGARIKDGRSRPVVPVNPLEGLERPKKRKPPEKFLLPDELRAFLKVPRPMRDSIVRDVLVDTGLRVAEMCAADVDDLFTVEQQTALQVTVKGGNTVQVPISKATVERLRDWLLSRNMPDPGEPLFIDTTGKRYHRAAMSHLIVRIGKVAGITRFEVTPHVVRHTLELIRRRAGIDPTVRSRLLTHSSLGSLVSYQHLLPDELAEARQQQVEGLRRYIGIADAGPQDYMSGLYQEGAGEERKSAEH